jgi:hypothetical protein
LQAISESFGLTRERVRQIVQQWTDENLHLDRIWPAPPVLQSLVHQLSLQESWDEDQLNALLASKFQTFWTQPRQLIAKLLYKFDSAAAPSQLDVSELLTLDSRGAKDNLPSKKSVQQAILRCSAKSCFALIDDVISDLAVIFPGTSAEDLRIAIQTHAMHGNLPLGYVCDSGLFHAHSPCLLGLASYRLMKSV